jgi:hypothetical protein
MSSSLTRSVPRRVRSAPTVAPQVALWDRMPVSPRLLFGSTSELELPARIGNPLHRYFGTTWNLFLMDGREVTCVPHLGPLAITRLISEVAILQLRRGAEERDTEARERRARAITHFVNESSVAHVDGWIHTEGPEGWRWRDGLSSAEQYLALMVWTGSRSTFLNEGADSCRAMERFARLRENATAVGRHADADVYQRVCDLLAADSLMVPRFALANAA